VRPTYAYDKESSSWKAAVHADEWYTKQRVDGNRFVPQQRETNKKLVFYVCSENEQLEQEPRALVVSDAANTPMRRMSLLRFGIATQKHQAPT
jgi:hypothetical protein